MTDVDELSARTDDLVAQATKVSGEAERQADALDASLADLRAELWGGGGGWDGW